MYNAVASNQTVLHSTQPNKIATKAVPRYLQGIDRFHLDARSTKMSPVWRSTLVTPASARSPVTSQLGQRCLATGKSSQGDDRSLPALPGAVHFRLRLTLAGCLQKPSGRVSSSVRKRSVFSWSAKTSSSYWMESCCQQKTAVLTQSKVGCGSCCPTEQTVPPTHAFSSSISYFFKRPNAWLPTTMWTAGFVVDRFYAPLISILRFLVMQTWCIKQRTDTTLAGPVPEKQVSGGPTAKAH